MRTLVIYYSRTGTTRKVAQALADMLGADTAEIRCERYGVGGLGYIRAAYDSVRGARPAIVIPTAVESDYGPGGDCGASVDHLSRGARTLISGRQKTVPRQGRSTADTSRLAARQSIRDDGSRSWASGRGQAGIETHRHRIRIRFSRATSVCRGSEAQTCRLVRTVLSKSHFDL